MTNKIEAPSEWELKRQAEQDKLEAEKLGPAEAKLVAVVKELGYTVIPDSADEGGRNWRTSVGVRAKMGDTGATLVLGAYGYQEANRIRVGCYFPNPERGESSHYGIERPSIGLSVDKTVDEIVKDIRRRFMPEFEVQLLAVQALNAQAVEYFDSRTKNIEAVLGRPAKKDEARGDGKLYIDGLPGSIYGNARFSKETVNLELSSVPAKLAAKIVKLLRKEGEKNAD